jgi:phage tail sheath protein FI
MPEYMSPGVYVEEVPSAVKPIAGVSTSTAAFVGVVPPKITMVEENPDFDPTKDVTAPGGGNSRYTTWEFPYPQADYDKVKKTLDDLSEPNSRPRRMRAGGDAKAYRKAQEDYAKASSRAVGDMADAGQPILCTSFSDFKRSFGGFSQNGLPALPAPGAAAGGGGAAPAAAPEGFQNQLAHAVYGFFQNGGTRCYVMRYPTLADLQNPENWEPLEAIDDISLVAAPGILDETVLSNLIDHCEKLSSRFAILDSPVEPNEFTEKSLKIPPRNTDYAAIYFPHIRIFDQTTKLLDSDNDGRIAQAPSGHIAGIYSRVDHQRGVHKAPANEVIRGALDVEHQISRAQQDGLNPYGINCIRFINENITVWGARTIGGDANTDLKYINVRRTLIYLRESIDRGTQWVVFEPNDMRLWAKIRLNVSAFLTTVWRDGALFGSTPQEAFYVKCDEETNPREERDLGRVITEIGVAIVRPAEFVIFRISQWAGPEG